MYVIDTDWGCGIIQRGSQPVYQDNIVNESTILTYEYLESHRKDLLNLITVNDFQGKHH